MEIKHTIEIVTQVATHTTSARKVPFRLHQFLAG